MGDAAEILGIKKPSKDETLKSPVARSEKKVMKKSKSEIQALKKPVDDQMNLFKKKRVVGSHGTHWKWRGFQNPARSDHLALFHWQKENDSDEYFFNRFNKKPELISYTDEMYEKYLVSPDWTREETDELWDLLRRFDLRFLVVADRITKQRSVEEIKDRYYSISKIILEKTVTNPEDLASHPIIAFCYNREEEEKRKKDMEILFNRTKEQIEEEIYLRGEMKRIEGIMKKQQVLKKKKTIKKKDESQSVSSTQPLAVSSTSSSFSKKELKAERKKGSTLRSLDMVNPLSANLKVQKKVEEILVSEGLGYMPMATKEIAQAFQKIQLDILLSIDLEKHLQQQQCHMQSTEREKKPSVGPISKRTGTNDPNKVKKKKKKKE